MRSALYLYKQISVSGDQAFSIGSVLVSVCSRGGIDHVWVSFGFMQVNSAWGAQKAEHTGRNTISEPHWLSLLWLFSSIKKMYLHLYDDMCFYRWAEIFLIILTQLLIIIRQQRKSWSVYLQATPESPKHQLLPPEDILLSNDSQWVQTECVHWSAL